MEVAARSRGEGKEDAMDEKFKAKQKREAERRIKILDLHPTVSSKFQENGEVYYSKRIRGTNGDIVAVLYRVSNKPEWQEKIKAFEERCNALVYHATHENTEAGELLTLLYVSDCSEEWADERADLKARDRNGNFYTMAYVVNLDDVRWSEFGTVRLKEVGGGLIRTV